MLLLCAALLFSGAVAAAPLDHHQQERPAPRPAGQDPQWFVSVLDFGAVADGKTDDTSAFVDALASSLDVFVPNGTYLIRRPLQLRSRQTLRGAGEWHSHLVFHPLPHNKTAGGVACLTTDRGWNITNDTPPFGFDSSTYGVTVEKLWIESFDHSHADQTLARNLGTRAIDFTAATYSTISHVRVSQFHTGVFLSRGLHFPSGCWFNNVFNVDFASTKYAVDINDDCGQSVNNCNFGMLHTNGSQSDYAGGTILNGVGYRITGYGHHFSDIYAVGHLRACVDFGASAVEGPEGALSYSGDNLVTGLYCEGGPEYAIRVSNSTGGRLGNKVENVHLDHGCTVNGSYGGGAQCPGFLFDPWGELSVSTWNAPVGDTAGVGVPGGPSLTNAAWRVGQAEIFSVGQSRNRTFPQNGTTIQPATSPGPVHHASFWRPEGERVGRAAGAITSNLAGTHVTYGTAAGRHLFEPDSLDSRVTGALDRVLASPPVRQLRFKAEPSETVEGFIADELRLFAPSAVSTSSSAEASPDAAEKMDFDNDDDVSSNQFVDNAKLVPILWQALRELAAETRQLRATVRDLQQANKH